MQAISSIAFAIISAVLLFLSTPGYDYYPFAFVGFVPVFYAVWKYKKTILPSIIFSITFYMLSLKWIVVTVSDFGNAPLFVGVFLLFLLSCYLCLYFLAFFIFFKRYENILFISSIFVALEFFKGKVFTGFPWLNLGLTQYNNPMLLKVFPIIGELGISFLIIAVNLIIFRFLFEKEKRCVKHLLWIIALVLVSNLIKYNNDFIEKTKISVIQPAYSQQDKWNPSKKNILIESVLGLLIDTKERKESNIIILPESVFPTFCNEEPELMKLLNEISQDVPLIFGCLTKENGKLFNSIYFMSSAKIDRYDKIHLVPFGEYFPFKNLLKPIEHYFFQNTEDFSRGKFLKVFKMGNVKYGGLICYESAFTKMVREILQKEANVLVFLTNDSWFGNSNGRWQHYAIDLVRGLEYNRPVVRATQSGISSCISPFSKKNQMLLTGEKGVLTCDVNLTNRNTFFSKIGYWWLIIVFGFALFWEKRE